MTHRERMLRAARGDQVDQLPYAPRIDLWYHANKRAGTLPLRHGERSPYEIARAEGWAIHAVVVDFTDQPEAEALLHRAIGLYKVKEQVFRFVFSPEIGIHVARKGDRTIVEYHTPVGVLSTSTLYTDEMKRSGVSLPWIDEHLIKGLEDYRVAARLFEGVDLVPHFEDFRLWQERVGEDGLCATWLAGCASPVHHIQKYLVDATTFFYHYHDHPKELQALAEALSPLYEKALRIVADSPAEIVNWGGNFDEQITYPPYFEKAFVPWIRKAAHAMEAKGKLVLCHCDGENKSLMDLIRDSGMHVAEAICPYPMTKVRLEAYYRRWRERLTLFGGIPSNLLLPSTTARGEFEAFLQEIPRAIAPGDRFILGVADTTPPDADFERLVQIGAWVAENGHLPLEGSKKVRGRFVDDLQRG